MGVGLHEHPEQHISNQSSEHCIPQTRRIHGDVVTIPDVGLCTNDLSTSCKMNISSQPVEQYQVS